MSKNRKTENEGKRGGLNRYDLDYVFSSEIIITKQEFAKRNEIFFKIKKTLLQSDQGYSGYK
jgi:hypothetical protein